MQKRFQSVSTGEQCTAAQYIAELLLTRQAKKDKKILPHKFWNHPDWKKKYKLMMIRINGLLKLYDEMAVVKALQSQKGKNIYSIGCPWLDELIEEEEKKLKEEPKVVEKIEEIKQEIKQPKKSFGKKNNLSNLRELDG